MAETTVLDELDDRIKEIADLSNENKKQEAFTKLETLNQDISALGSRGRSERNMSLIRGEMMAKQKVNRELASLKAWAAAREAQQQEEADCLIVGNSVNGDISGASEQYLERNSNGIVIGFEGSNKNRTCLNRDVLSADNLRNALVEVCTDEGQPNGDIYVNMRKLGVITDAIVPLEQIFTIIIATDKKRFNLHKKLDEDGDHEQVLIISFGVAGMFRGKDDSEKANRIYWMNQKLMEDYGLSEQELPIANPELVSPSLENFIEVSNAVSAAHCEPGDEKSIYELKPVTPFENKELVAEGYNRLVSTGFVRDVTQYPIDHDKLDQLARETANLLQVYEPSAPQIQQSSNEIEDQEEEDMKALINCALAKWFEKNGAFEQYTADRFDNRILTPEQNYELKLKAIFGEEWVNSRIPPAERGGWAEDKITSEKLRQNTIDYINREDNSQPDSVKRMELDWIINAPDSVYETIIADLQEEVGAKIETLENLTRNLKLMDTIEVFDDHMERMIDRYCSPEDGEDIARGLFSDSQEVSSIDIERIINCAFGEYYRTGGTFDQNSQEENEGNAVSEDELNNRKIENIYSRKWVDVVLFGGDDECYEDDTQPMYEYVDDERERILVRGCDYITPNGLKDIAKDYVEKRFREGKISQEERQQLKDGIGSFDYENTKRELNDLKTELYYRIQQALDQTQRPAEEFIIINEEDRSQDAPTPELISICRDVISSFSDELVRNNCNRNEENLPVARQLDFGNVSSAETESVVEDDKYEKLVYCAFGKWYGEDGKFEQLSKEQASGDGDPEPTINEITNQKMKDIFSDQWKTVLLDRSSESYHNVGGWDREGMTRIFESLNVNMDDPNTKPLDEAKLISITKSYIEEDDLWSTAQAKNEEIQKLESWASEGNPTKDQLNNIQATLYDKINRIAAETARRAAGDDIDENDENVGYWDDHNSQLLDICTIEIDDYTAELVRYNCLGGVTQQRPDTPDYDPSLQPDADEGFYDMEPDLGNSSAETASVYSDDDFSRRAGEVEAPGSQDSFNVDNISEIDDNNSDLLSIPDGLLTPVSNRSRSSSENDILEQPMTPPMTPDDGGPMSPSDLDEANDANQGGKKKKRKKSKKGKKTRKKKANKNKKKKKTKRRVKFNLKNNEYYTITPKNKIRKNKKRRTRKKKH